MTKTAQEENQHKTMTEKKNNHREFTYIKDTSICSSFLFSLINKKMFCYSLLIYCHN
jgi:hypothetical protein